MMKLPVYQVDAFADAVFSGNPAAVCPLEHWLPDDTLLAIAAENNLAETAFFVPLPDAQGFHLRWFTPEIEMDLCGHATLATAHVLFRHAGFSDKSLVFHTQSGRLEVTRNGALLSLDFPSRPPQRLYEAPDVVLRSMGQTPLEIWKARDYMLVYDSEATVRNLRPDRNLLDTINLDPGGVIATAPGDTVDFVSRFFTPQAAIFEDPVTGSAHCTLIPYWAERLQKTALNARQISARGGALRCALAGERVQISGKCVTYMEGSIFI